MKMYFLKYRSIVNKAIGFGLILIFISACQKEAKLTGDNNLPTPKDTMYHPTPFVVTIPTGWSSLPIPADNPFTVEGIALGRKLFYDKILSANNTMSCSSCHNQQFAFTDNGKQFSVGIDNIQGTRQAMPIFNLAWVERFAPTAAGRPVRFFWDGGATNLESQVVGPITNPIEMHDSLVHVLYKLQADKDYPLLFYRAFGSYTITSAMLMKAIAQFERTIISANAKIDKYFFGSTLYDLTVFTPEERRGYDVFITETKGDCFHCHPVTSVFLTDFLFHNNGHTSNDIGLKKVTGNDDDVGKFRSASLRNLLFTAPYMHDGRFQTLEEVVEYYNSGASRVWPADPFITKHPNGLNLTTQEKSDLVAFLKTMSDSTLLTNPLYSKP